MGCGNQILDKFVAPIQILELQVQITIQSIILHHPRATSEIYREASPPLKKGKGKKEKRKEREREREREREMVATIQLPAPVVAIQLGFLMR